MEIVPFTKSHIEEAQALAFAAYQKEREALPFLPVANIPSEVYCVHENQ